MEDRFEVFTHGGLKTGLQGVGHKIIAALFAEYKYEISGNIFRSRKFNVIHCVKKGIDALLKLFRRILAYTTFKVSEASYLHNIFQGIGIHIDTAVLTPEFFHYSHTPVINNPET